MLVGYIIGSRMWGTATEASDWDLLFILDDPKLEKSTVHISTIVDACCINQNILCNYLFVVLYLIIAKVMGKAYFLEQLEQQHMQEVVLSQIPQRCIIKQNLNLASHFKLEKISFYHSVLTEGERDILL